MLAACGPSGLMKEQNGWQQLDCPLPSPELLATSRSQLAVLDNTTHAVWAGPRIFAVDSGVEAMLLWDGRLLTLSGDTDCLTLFSLSTGQPQLTIPAGVYPQDMCLLPGGRSLAVCGGADGTLRVIRLPELWEEQSIRLPGNVQRAACVGSVLYVLCAVEDDGLCCLLCRIQNGRWSAMARWPGLPGAIHADPAGRLWVAASEVLCCFRQGEHRAIPGEFGLIRRIDSRPGKLLASDPVMDVLWLVDGWQTKKLHEGNVQHGVFV